MIYFGCWWNKCTFQYVIVAILLNCKKPQKTRGTVGIYNSISKATLLWITVLHILFQVRPSEALTSHHYPCTCIKELWILLIQLLDHRNKGSHTEVMEEYCYVYVCYICNIVAKCSQIAMNTLVHISDDRTKLYICFRRTAC